MGVGQAHKVLPEGGIERFFAYSVLTDSTGAFQEIRLLGTGHDEKSYIDAFHDSLRRDIRGLRGSVLEFRSAQYVLDPEAGAGQHCGRSGRSGGSGGRRILCLDEVQ